MDIGVHPLFHSSLIEKWLINFYFDVIKLNIAINKKYSDRPFVYASWKTDANCKLTKELHKATEVLSKLIYGRKLSSLPSW